MGVKHVSGCPVIVLAPCYAKLDVTREVTESKLRAVRFLPCVQ